MKTTKPHTASQSSVWDAEPRPDVPWGEGGIDDWGWTAWESVAPCDPRLSTSSPNPPKELIPHAS
jgi:hypothetical protein